MNELFSPEIGKMDSPRLAWMKKHEITVEEYPGEIPPEETYCAYFGNLEDHLSRFGDEGFGWGATQDEALADLALKFRIPLWNEEAAIPMRVAIKDEVFDVRKVGEEREVFYKGEWLNAAAFIDRLWETGRRDMVVELAKHGWRAIRQEAEGGAAYDS